MAVPFIFLFLFVFIFSPFLAYAPTGAPAIPDATCTKTFVVNGPGGRQFEMFMWSQQAELTPKMIADQYNAEGPIYGAALAADTYKRLQGPTRKWNCAGFVMDKVFSTGQYATDTDKLMHIITTFKAGEFRLTPPGYDEHDRIQAGDLLMYPSKTAGGNAHVAVVTRAQWVGGDWVITIQSKDNQQSIFETTMMKMDWSAHPVRRNPDPLVTQYSLPVIYRLTPGVSVTPKTGGSVCDTDKLIVQVLDKGTNGPVTNARVRLAEGGAPASITTDSNGEAKSFDKYKGLEVKLEVSHPDYYTKTDTVAIPQTAWTVFLEKKLDIKAVTQMFEGEIATLIRLRDAAKAARESAETYMGGSRGRDVSDARDLLRLLDEAKKEIERANNNCIQAAGDATQAAGDAAKVSAARNAAITQANFISAQAPNCKSKADVDALDKAWETASKEGGTALAFGARAEGTIGKVTGVVTAAQAAQTSLVVSKAPPAPSVKYLMERLVLINLPGRDFYNRIDALIRDADGKKAVFEKAKNDLLWKILTYRGKMGAGNEAAFDALAGRVRAISLADKDLIAMRNGLVADLKAIYDAKKDGNTIQANLAALPLCSGINTTGLSAALKDVRRAQGDVVQYVTPDLKEKINACRLKLNLPEPPSGPFQVTKPWRAFGVYPQRVTLAPGQAQTFTATLAYNDGTAEDISKYCTWTPSRIFRADKAGTWLVKAEVKLDQLRVDYASVKVPGDFSISGPTTGIQGARATFRASGPFMPAASGFYTFRWFADGKQFSSTTDSQIISLQTPGPHVVTVKVWNWSGAKWEPLGEKSMTVAVSATEPPNTTGSYVKGRILGSARLPARESKSTKTGVVLEKGKPYIVVGKGSVSLWDGQTDGCDSVFRYKTPLEKNGGPLKVWGQLKLVNPTAHLSDLIKQQTGKDPIYNPGHVYEAVVIGQGSQLEALVFDGGGYGDNHGELTVEVYEAVRKN